MSWHGVDAVGDRGYGRKSERFAHESRDFGVTAGYMRAFHLDRSKTLAAG